MIEIRKANSDDIKLIESKYLQRIDELADKGIIQWSKSEVLWSNLCLSYKIDDFYILSVDDNFAGCFCVVDDDRSFWKNDEPHKYLYIHKIIVLEAFSGQGLGNVILSYFKELGKKGNYEYVKLDVRDYKKKLRKLYEKNGFELDYKDLFNGNDYFTCLYKCKVG